MTQQEQLTKQLRKQQKELKENSGALTNQKTNFMHLQALLDMKLKCEQDPTGESRGSGSGRGSAGYDRGGEVFTPAHAEPLSYDSNSRAGSRGNTAGSREHSRGHSRGDEKQAYDNEYY